MQKSNRKTNKAWICDIFLVGVLLCFLLVGFSLFLVFWFVFVCCVSLGCWTRHAQAMKKHRKASCKDGREILLWMIDPIIISLSLHYHIPWSSSYCKFSKHVWYLCKTINACMYVCMHACMYACMGKRITLEHISKHDFGTKPFFLTLEQTLIHHVRKYPWCTTSKITETRYFEAGRVPKRCLK